jgi:ABC-type phosphate transport system permease subunit
MANGEAAFVLPLLIGSLILVALIMLWALWLAYRQAVYTGERI